MIHGTHHAIPDHELVVFVWSTKHGKCEECGLPAAFYYVNAYGIGKHMAVCSVCAANNAADGATIRRIEDCNV